MLLLHVLPFFASSLSANAATTPRRVFVSGAGGQTGQHVFRKLLSRPNEFVPVGIVRSEESRQALLESGGISESSVVVCDVTDPVACAAAMQDCDAAVICTSAKPSPTGAMDEESGRPIFGYPNGQPDVVDWMGQKNQIDAAKKAMAKHVIVCSSMGGTSPENPLNNLGRENLPDGTTSGGDILKWKRKAEAYLIESGLFYTIVHPGGLLNEDGGKRELCLGVDDKNTLTDNNSVPREDVAEVLVQALLIDEYRGRSVDLVSKPEGDGVVTTDYAALLAALDGKNCDYALGEIAM